MDALLDLARIAATVRQVSAPLSISDLGDDLLHHVLAFVSDRKDLRSFALTHRRANRWVFHSQAAKALFRILYKRTFGDEMLYCKNDDPWQSLFRMKHHLSNGIPTTNPFSFTSAAILSPAEEVEAIGYDHPYYFRNGQSIGYFGFARLFPRGGPVAIWGDFDGVRIVPSIDHLLPGYVPHALTDEPAVTICGDSRVLTVLTNTTSSTPSYDSNTVTTFFLGFASGRVMAIKAVKESVTGRYSYVTVSSAAVHTDEVTALAVVPVQPPCIASCSVDGTVWMYPDALTTKQSLATATLVCMSDSVLTLTAAPLQAPAPPQPAGCQSIQVPPPVLLCTGDRKGMVTLWSQLQHYNEKDPHKTLVWAKMCSLPVERDALPTRIRFLKADIGQVVVVGTNGGSLHIFGVSMQENSGPTLQKLHSRINAHFGAIDSINVVGDVILASGGYDGLVRGWDVTTLNLLGSISAHPGRLYPPAFQISRGQALLKCAVISSIVCHDRESVVSLCRDGTLHEWFYGGEVITSRKQVVVRSTPEEVVSVEQEEVHHMDTSGSEVGPTGAELSVSDPAVRTMSVNVDVTGAAEASTSAEVGSTHPEFRSICDLMHVMSTADESMKGRMQMRIIQAALQKRLEPTFMGADNIRYDNTEAAFDRYSGLSPCQDCLGVGKAVFFCRIQSAHPLDVDKSHAAILFRRLRNTRKAWLEEDEPVWFCSGCNVDNKASKRRCFMCQKWKDGKHPISKPRNRQSQEPVEETLVKSVEIPHVPDHEPRSLEELSRIMSPSTDAAIRGRMQMRIIQAALQRQLNQTTPKPAFDAALSINDEHVEEAFDGYSGVAACTNCISNGLRPYVCRINEGHVCDLDRSHASVMFQRLRNTRKAWLKKGDTVWFCYRCNVDNKVPKTRCFMCQKWKDGRHPMNKAQEMDLASPSGVESIDCVDSLLAIADPSFSPDSLAETFSASDDAMKGRLQMRIIQTALQHKLSLAGALIEVAEVLNISNVANAFDIHSGVKPCTDCQRESIGAFNCRLLSVHQNELDLTHGGVLFQRLSNSRRAWLRDGEKVWSCSRCNIDNKLSKTRCFLCQSWKDGKHPVSKPREQPVPSSLTATKVSDSSMEETSELGSPSPQLPVESSLSLTQAPQRIVSYAQSQSTGVAVLANAAIAAFGQAPPSMASLSTATSLKTRRKRSSDGPDIGDIDRKIRKRQSKDSGIVSGSNSARPRAVDTLEQIMSPSADATMRGRMQVCIIQAGCQNRLNATLPFRGADKLWYETTKMAFDRYSGLVPCKECQTAQLGPFMCRVTLEHMEDIGDSLAAVVFRRMRTSKRAWILDGEAVWFCSHCNVDNKKSKRRCFLCQRWKGGKHPQGLEKEIVVDQGVKGPTVTVWECYACFHRNHWRKYMCTGCGRRAGGRKMDIPNPHFKNSQSLDVPAAARATPTPPLSNPMPLAHIRGAAPDATWVCHVCTHVSPESVSNCSTCAAPKRGVASANEPPQASQTNDKACPTCGVDKKFFNPHCSDCQRWKDGESVNATKTNEADDTKRQLQDKSVQRTVPSPRKRSSPVKVWECLHCSHRNNMRKAVCGGCGKEGEGGRVVQLPLKHKLLVSETPAPSLSTWSCHKCTFINQVTSSKCKMCSIARKRRRIDPSNVK